MSSENEADIRARVRTIIREVAPNPEGFRDGPGTHLVDDLAFHSLALLELGFTLEDDFGLPPLDQAQVQHITTVGEVEDQVLELLHASAEK